MTPPEPADLTSPRVNRGGGWYVRVPSWVGGASRDTIEPADRYSLIGFRTTLPVRQPR
jgi:hypothetical protein